MKNLFLFFLLFTLSSTNFAQNRADYQFQFAFNNEFQEWRKASDGNLLGLIRPTLDPYHYEKNIGAGLVKFSPTGDSVLWATECQLAPEVTVGLDFLEMDSFILVCQLWGACDVGGNQLRFFGLEKETGAILFMEESGGNQSNYTSEMRLLPLDLGGFRLETDSYISDFNNNREQIAYREKLSLIEYSETNTQQDSIFYRDYALRLQKSDGTTYAYALPEISKDVQALEANKWVVLGETKIYIFSSALVLEKETALIGIADWSKINKVKDELWIFVENANPQAYCLDTTTYEIKRILDFEADYQVKNAFFQENDHTVWLSGDYLGSRNKRFFMHKTDIQNPSFATEDVDIELLEISWSGTPTGGVYFCSPLSYYYTGARFDTVLVKVRNNGLESVSTFFINGFFYNECAYCGYYTRAYRISVDTLLASGESRVFKLVYHAPSSFVDE